MTITHKPDEKYAYLFATDVSMRYLRDLENVYNTLIQYYSYPDTNIWIVFRGTPAAADLALLAGLTAATKKFVLPAAFTEAEILETFEDGLAGKGLLYKILADLPCVGIDEKKVLLMYVTGSGNNGNLLTTSDAVPIDNDWLEQRFMWFDPASMPIRSIDDVCQVHVVMQQPFGESLKNSVLGLSSYSFTFACANGQASSDGTAAVGSYFTVGWTKALQFEKLPATAPNSPNLYADEIGVVLPAVTNLLINMRQAQLFAVDYCLVNYAPGGTNSSPNCDTSSTDPYLGKPVVRIKDGSERVPPRSWVESPDIWITCLTYYPEATSYDNDYYVYDEDNTIHLRAHVEGTHPVRQIFIGSKIFRSGGGGPGEVHTAIFAPANVILPGLNDTYTYTYFYDSGYAHSCIKARVSLQVINDADIDDSPTNEWDPYNRIYEAQRNTDPSGLKSSSGGAGADAGEGKVDEAAPEEEAKPETDNPETDTDTKSTKNLRAFKEHVYVIKNTFRFARDFRYVIDPELIKRKKEFKFRWMRVDPEYPDKLMELKVVMEPYPHIPFELKRGEEVHIVNYIGLEKGVRIEKPFNINFNIEMGAMKVRRLFSIRLNGLTRMRYRPFSGVVMRIMEGSFTLKGTLKSRDKKLLNEAVIIVKTIDGRQSAAARVNEKGDWIFRDINPDIYQVWAKAGKLESKRVIVHGQPVKKALPDKPVVLEL